MREKEKWMDGGRERETGSVERVGHPSPRKVDGIPNSYDDHHWKKHRVNNELLLLRQNLFDCKELWRQWAPRNSSFLSSRVILLNSITPGMLLGE